MNPEEVARFVADNVEPLKDTVLGNRYRVAAHLKDGTYLLELESPLVRPLGNVLGNGGVCAHRLSKTIWFGLMYMRLRQRGPDFAPPCR
jgi:hypothetical protein